MRGRLQCYMWMAFGWMDGMVIVGHRSSNNVNIITAMLIIVLIFSLEEDSWKGIFNFPQCIEANNGQSP